jgi:hypothetical protein
MRIETQCPLSSPGKPVSAANSALVIHTAVCSVLSYFAASQLYPARLPNASILSGEAPSSLRDWSNTDSTGKLARWQDSERTAGDFSAASSVQRSMAVLPRTTQGSGPLFLSSVSHEPPWEIRAASTANGKMPPSGWHFDPYE